MFENLFTRDAIGIALRRSSRNDVAISCIAHRRVPGGARCA